MPKYEPNIWNLDENVKHSHNCYSYFLNLIDEKAFKNCKTKKQCSTAQPGYYNGLSNKMYNYTRKKRSPSGFRYKCNNVLPRIKADNPNVKFIGKNTKKCPKGYYQGAMATTSPQSWDKSDYHFYRKDNNTDTWSHKTGKQEVKNYDAKGNLIFDPLIAARKYARNDYSEFCGYFCIPEEKEKKNMSSINLINDD